MRRLFLLLLLTSCDAGNKEQKAEQAVQTYLQRKLEACGSRYQPGAFETRSFPSGKHSNCYQIRHTYSVTVQKGAIVQEKGSFFVDSVGIIHPY